MKSITYNNPLFLNNKYTRWYFAIIQNAKNKNVIGYTESHHIIPRCLNGKETVHLTAREHFICHLLLTKMTEGKIKRKMIYALNRFINRNKKQNLVRITARQYEYYRRMYIKNHPMKTKSIANKVKETQFNKYGNYAFATESVREKQQNTSIKKYGVKYAMLAFNAALHTNKLILTCPHCNKTGKTLAAMKRWHFDRCKSIISLN